MQTILEIEFIGLLFIETQGLYAENHGVLSNEMYDMKLKKSFKYGYEMFHYSDYTEPIWVSLNSQFFFTF